MSHTHDIEYEFPKGKFPSWRGDQWCKTCDYAIYSREAKRMEMFGLIENITPPQYKESTGTADSAMFKVTNLKVI